MRHYILPASTFLLISISGIANAADPIVAQDPTPVAAPNTYNWSGAYIGGQIGSSWQKAKYFHDIDGLMSHTSGTKNKNSFIGGVYAGYNFDIGNNVILGADLDFAKGFKAQKNTLRYGSTGLSQSTELDWSGAARARMGYTLDRFMPYLAGGVAFGNVKSSYHNSQDDESGSKSKVRTGWTVGGGVDYAATDNVILRLEYRYTDFGKQKIATEDNVKFSNKLSSNDIRLGVAYKF